MSTAEPFQDKVRLNECVWSKVPEEITARLLSLLPVPDLCVCRSVCKTWNELLRQPDFLTLCHRKDAYLFVTGHLSNRDSSWVHDAYRRTPCFFDLENQRWFSIPVDATGVQHNVAQLLAMDDGLICELSVAKNEFKLVMLDPVAKTRRELPSIPGDDGPVFRLSYDAPPAIVTVVENDCNFNVFLISSRALSPHTGFFLYESKTDAWRDLGNPVQELGKRSQTEPHLLSTEVPIPVSDGPGFAETAVYFQGHLFATFYILARKTVLLLSYNLRTNTWKEVMAVASTTSGYSSLTVIHNRMFMAMWVDETLQSSQRNTTTRSKFEIKELFVNQGHGSPSRNSVVQISYVDAKRMFYGALPVHNEFRLQYDVALGFPVNENLSSVVMVSRQTGKMILYNVGSKGVGALPEHPLRQACLEFGREGVLPVTFRAKLVNLSSRNVLSVCRNQSGFS